MGGRRTLILVGLIVIAVAIIIVVLVLRGMNAAEPVEETPTPEPVRLVPIVIAANNLDRGTRITNEHVETVDWPEDQVPNLPYFSDENEVYGRVVRAAISQGSFIISSQLAEELLPAEGGGSDLALSIDPGKRAMAVPMDILGGVAWYIQPGDHVDVLASWNVVDLDEEFQSPLPNNWVILECPESFECQGVFGRMELLPTGQAVMVVPNGISQSGYFAQMTIQDAVVLSIGPHQEIPPAPTVSEEAADEAAQLAEEPTPIPPVSSSNVIILLLDAQDVLVVKALLELQANIDLVLRGVDDRDPADTVAVTLDYIVNRYGIEQPPKLPYGITPPNTSLLGNSYMQRAIQEAGQVATPSE